MVDEMFPTTGPVRVTVVPERDAEGQVAALYGEVRQLFSGFVPDVFKLVSSRAEFLEAFVAGYRSMFVGGELPPEAKEAVAVTVARTASCAYCSTAHDVLLRLTGPDQRLADALAAGALDDEAVSPPMRSLVDLAARVSTAAYRITDEDLARVRSHGWTEAQVLEAVWIACVFNGIVRLADTLGLYALGQLDDALVP